MSKLPHSSTVKNLMYEMVCRRIDIAHVVGIVSRYMNNLGKEQWMVVKRILKYLRDTNTHALCFGVLNSSLHGYVNSDMVGDKDSKRSTIGYVFTMHGTIVSFILRLQQVVLFSSIEVEYVDATMDSKEMVWLHRFMEELGKKQENIRLYSDRKISIYLANDSTFHSNTKHILLWYHFIR